MDSPKFLIRRFELKLQKNIHKFLFISFMHTIKFIYIIHKNVHNEGVS